jgi:DNA-binding NtrC family response regulator
MRRLAAQVRKIAALRLPVLLRGESGTGKDLVARALHDESQRARRPFVAINAATISRELAESELFGHQRGAFTGAVRDRKGAFREASTGTLFLDEIGSVPLDVQAKLLRVVEESVVRPLGAEQAWPWTCAWSRRPASPSRPAWPSSASAAISTSASRCA